MVNLVDKRRRLLTTASLAGAGFLVGLRAPSRTFAAGSSKKFGQEKEVGAVEDLMHEHGVLRQRCSSISRRSRGFAPLRTTYSSNRLPGRQSCFAALARTTTRESSKRLISSPS